MLNSIDSQDIMKHYGKDHSATASVLKKELEKLISLKPDCLILCCNSLHKYLDLIKEELNTNIPIFHAIDLLSEEIRKKKYNSVLLLATRFALEDGFITKKLECQGVNVVIPSHQERIKIQKIHDQLAQNQITPQTRVYFSNLTKKYSHQCEAVILGCTEYPLALNESSSFLKILNPIELHANYSCCRFCNWHFLRY